MDSLFNFFVSSSLFNNGNAHIPSQNFNPEAVLTAEKVKFLLHYLKQHHNGQSQTLSFTNNEGQTYLAWFVPTHQAVNIQTEESFYNNPFQNKLGLKISENGVISSVYVDGHPNNEIPEARRNWLLNAYQACHIALPILAAPQPQPTSAAFTMTTPQPQPTPAVLTITSPLEVSAPQFSSADLMTFRTALQKTGQIQIGSNNQYYAVWYNSNFSAINIQDAANYNAGNQENKLGIIIDPAGKITSLWVNGTALPNTTLIPEEFSDKVRACFKKALEVSSTYVINTHPSFNISFAKIEVVRRGLNAVQDFHLINLSETLEKGIKSYQDPKFKVGFLRDNLTFDYGIDEGGLSRDYLNDLFEACAENPMLSMEQVKPSTLWLPKTKAAYEQLNPLPLLDPNEIELYRAIGKIMMYCFNSRTVPGYWDATCSIGRHFDDALFKAALCLTAEEMDTSFKDLSLNTQLKMAKALLAASKEAGNETAEGIFKNRINYLERFSSLPNFNNVSDADLTSAALDIFYADCLPDEFGEEDDLKLDVIKQKPAMFKQALFDSVFFPKNDHGQIGAQLAPLHAIAKGMKSFCHPGLIAVNPNVYWNHKFMNKNYLDFSKKVQGSINRQEIVDNMKLDLNVVGLARIEIEKKVNWLKEWLLDTVNGASDDELKNFLKFATGTSGLPQGKMLTIQQQAVPYFPVPKAHTCSFAIDISPQPCKYGSHNDYTKENFIKSLKELALPHATAYQNN
jgi:hypothetical protein